ncbi:MAG: Asp-tRNA(Asn)/Glu-tRNA(Gln) amidotransferase subunit GatC [Clostridia bacterium]|nr:Asp-tRNA(Asn)/Glu-tRNA(Gln) amidotransferase subunit GatC [Clostridia bacterium]
MITPEELRRLAQLAKLEIKDEDMPALTEQMERMVAFAGAVCRADAGVQGQTLPAEDFSSLREDTVLPSLPREEILQNAENTTDGYFCTGKRGAEK